MFFNYVNVFVTNTTAEYISVIMFQSPSLFKQIYELPQPFLRFIIPVVFYICRSVGPSKHNCLSIVVY